jgi:ankyrin repeat protein
MSYLLTNKNMNGSTILHKACHIGNLEIVKEILRLAGPDNLDVLKFVIND